VLSAEPFTLLGYPVETVVAEKVDTMITRGDANTRERDYADVLMLSRTHALEARALRKALEERAAVTAVRSYFLSQTRWTPCQRPGRQAGGPSSTGLTDLLPESFEQAVRQVSEFVDPVLRSDPGLDRWNPSARAWT
jgi:hypothetical protein